MGAAQQKTPKPPSWNDGRRTVDRLKVYKHLQHTSNSQHADADGAGRAEGTRALSHRRAGGDDVFDDHHVTAGDRRRGREGAGHVTATLGRGEVALWCRRAEPSVDPAAVSARP